MAVCDVSAGFESARLAASGRNAAQFVTVCGPAFSFTVGGLTAVKPGCWLTKLATMGNVCGGEVSTPPLAVPPLSCSLTVTLAVPLASRRSV